MRSSTFVIVTIGLVLATIPVSFAEWPVLTTTVVESEFVRVGPLPTTATTIPDCGLEYAYKVEFYLENGCAPSTSAGAEVSYYYDFCENIKYIYASSDSACITPIASTTYADECITTGTTTFTETLIVYANLTAYPTPTAIATGITDALVDAANLLVADNVPLETTGNNFYFVGGNGEMVAISNGTKTVGIYAVLYDAIGYKSLEQGSCTAVRDNTATHYIEFTTNGMTGSYIAYTDGCRTGSSTTLDIISLDKTAVVTTTPKSTLFFRSSTSTYGTFTTAHASVVRLAAADMESVSVHSTVTQTGSGALPTQAVAGLSVIAMAIAAGGVLLL